MKFSEYLQKRIVDLLNERRIIVWYDPKQDFKDFITSFSLPSCTVLSASDSILKTRRTADEIYHQMNESDEPKKSRKNLLIYIPWSRGVDEYSKIRDPFEMYALAGASFGDTEDQKIESLARQAFPEKAEEITRLFREGRPTISILDGLESVQRYPILRQTFDSESPIEIIAVALCNPRKEKTIDDMPGSLPEFIRLVDESIGYKPSTKTKSWKTIRERLADYILFSEFIFDLPEGIPESMNTIDRADDSKKNVIYSICERMRNDANLCDSYIEMAKKIEHNFHLPDQTQSITDFGIRDTFPFEEERMFTFFVREINAGNYEKARDLLLQRRSSIWKRQIERIVLWTVADRAINLLETIAAVENQRPWNSENLSSMIKDYTQNGLLEIDRKYRLFEQSVTACEAEEELQSLIDLCRQKYRDLINRIQVRFLYILKRESWPPEGIFRQTEIFGTHVAPPLERREKTAYFLVDSLRYEMGQDLADALKNNGEAEISFAAGSLPTTTDVGMASLLPNANSGLQLICKNDDLVPTIGSRSLKNSLDRSKYFKEVYGDRIATFDIEDILSKSKKLKTQTEKVDLLIIKTQDPDLIGENLGARLARKYISDIIKDILTGVKILADLGFNRIIVTSDHGHILLPEILAGDVCQRPEGTWIEAKRRYCLGSHLSDNKDCIIFKADHVGIKGDITEVCIPNGLKVFSEGDSYFHGGISLQEAIIPVVIFTSQGPREVSKGQQHIKIRYKSDKFTSRVIDLQVCLKHADLFGTPLNVRIEAFDGPSPKAKIVGEAADCKARDEKTHEVTLKPGNEMHIPILIDFDFSDPLIEIRVSDPISRMIYARHTLTNGMMD